MVGLKDIGPISLYSKRFVPHIWKVNHLLGKGTGMLQNWNVFNVPWTVFERLFQNLDIFVILACQSVPAKGDCAKEFFNRCKSISKQGWVCLDKYIVPNQMGWIGTVEVNWDVGIDPGETFCLCLLAWAPCPDSPPQSRSTPSDGVHLYRCRRLLKPVITRF